MKTLVNAVSTALEKICTFLDRPGVYRLRVFRPLSCPHGLGSLALRLAERFDLPDERS